MKTRVIIGQHVKTFLESLAPEPRRKLWSALKGLASGKDDIRQLDGSLAPYWRLRVGRIRVIFDQRAVRGERHLICLFAEHRAAIYMVFEQLLASGLLEHLKESGAETHAPRPVKAEIASAQRVVQKRRRRS